MDLGLEGKRALVTGASRGLGFAAALGLAREGVNLAINSRCHEDLYGAAEKIIAETGVEVFPFSGDITQVEIPGQLISQTIQALGGLDLLFVNAGGPVSGRFETLEDADWQKAIDLCLMSYVRLIRAALPHLRESQAASVLTVTSLAAKQPIQNLILSNSVRSATIGLTKSLALELGSEGIRFNSILPSWITTERIQELMIARAEINGTTPEWEMDKQTKESPFGRMGKPEEFANAAVFLLSPAASYITGVMLTVDGGMYKGMF